MRAALITEGGYPYHTSSTSSWCHTLVPGLPRCSYHLVALTGPATDPPDLAYPLPANVTTLTQLPVWSPPVAPDSWLARRRHRRAATEAAILLCRGLAGGDDQPTLAFRAALRRLATLATDGVDPLGGVPTAEILADTWRAAGATPRLSLGNAHAAALLLEHALRPLAMPAPPVQVCHPTTSGLPLLVALAAKWRAGIPYLLTEQGIYLRERYLDYGGQLPESVTAVMLRFFAGLARVGYAEAAMVVAASRFNQRWQLRHGAHPASSVVIPGGLDPAAYPPRPEPEHPTLVSVGRITPSADLHTLIHACWRLRRDLPTARLRLVGPTTDPTYEAGCRALVRRLGLAEAITFVGPVADPADAYANAQVVVRSSSCEGQPYPVLEAMLSGRATVTVDVGGAAELVGDAGLLVPPGDPAALAHALGALLTEAPRRHTLAAAGRARAHREYRADRMLRAYELLYADVAANGPASPAPPTSRPRQPARALVAAGQR
ncbi:GT4 family glycosyltransferase PelF [Natronosporangium hydrolyticum]|uniref:GT4 family glycosyltransferase PelF n=1 Tax=Natronosporangium hydrolyticum TaxID=2811111 RepID=A0A895YB92_9ACTN|nr:GT4 family glycosyltransferase PelF [Natronosporangium hydrolyticum]QSB13555.1 GT4 family glycosyltransferase PelF [Natronosporangium hydrolyticum]